MRTPLVLLLLASACGSAWSFREVPFAKGEGSGGTGGAPSDSGGAGGVDPSACAPPSDELEEPARTIVGTLAGNMADGDFTGASLAVVKDRRSFLSWGWAPGSGATV